MWILVLLTVDAFTQGTALFDKGQFREAAALFEQAVRKDPENAQFWKALGAAHAAGGDHEAALEPFEKACTLAPALRDACYFHARNLYALNRFEPALTVLRRVLLQERDSARVYLGIAQSLEALGHADDADASFRSAVRLHKSPGNPEFDPKLYYAVFLFRQGRPADALPVARAVVAAYRGYPRGHFELGRILYHLGQLPEAAAELESAVQGGYGLPAQSMLDRVRLRIR